MTDVMREQIDCLERDAKNAREWLVDIDAKIDRLEAASRGQDEKLDKINGQIIALLEKLHPIEARITDLARRPCGGPDD